MKPIATIVLLTAALLLVCPRAFALSEELRSPRILFPKNYDAQRSAAILAVVQDKRFTFKTGVISYWVPQWSTTLVYSGDTKTLATFLNDLAKIRGLHTHVTFSKDAAKETGSALVPGSWWVKYSHTSPDALTVRINLSASDIDISKLELPIAPQE